MDCYYFCNYMVLQDRFLKKIKTNLQNQLYRVQILLPDDRKHGVKILAFPTV